MKQKLLLTILSLAMVLSLLLAACATGTTSTSSPTATTSIITTPSATAPPITSTVTTTTSTTTGTPQYGGTITTTTTSKGNALDPSSPTYTEPFLNYNVFEPLTIPDWSKGQEGTGQVDFDVSYIEEKYYIGLLAASWEMPNPTTIIFHLRQGIHWQNKAPVNGREITADDVVASYMRTSKNTFNSMFKSPPSNITATDKYTVTLDIAVPIFESIKSYTNPPLIVYPPEIVGADGNVNWKDTVGSGPYILSDYVSGTSITLTKNTDYWRNDPNHPNNKLPYADSIVHLMIPDRATQLAGLRTGKIDRMYELKPDEAQSLAKTNPKILQNAVPGSALQVLYFRADLKPFSDIRVRQALVMAIDLKGMLNDYFLGQGELVSYPTTYGRAHTPYDQLPQDIKALYDYNPQKAKQLLADAGYPNGFTTNTLLQNLSPWKDEFQIIKANWADIGVTVDGNFQETAAALSMGSARKYDTYLTVFSGSPDRIILKPWIKYDISNYWWGLDTTTQGKSSWDDPDIDSLQTQILQATDPNEQTDLMKQLNLLIMGRVYGIGMPAASGFVVWQPWIKGYKGEWGLGGNFGHEAVFPYMWVDQTLK